jgi:hypothetical protein
LAPTQRPHHALLLRAGRDQLHLRLGVEHHLLVARRLRREMERSAATMHQLVYGRGTDFLLGLGDPAVDRHEGHHDSRRW